MINPQRCCVFRPAYTGADRHDAGADRHNAGADRHNAGADRHNAEADRHNAGVDGHNAGADGRNAGADRHNAGADRHDTGADRHRDTSGHRHSHRRHYHHHHRHRQHRPQLPSPSPSPSQFSPPSSPPSPTPAQQQNHSHRTAPPSLNSPVLPLVYSLNRGASESIHATGHESVGCTVTASCHHASRPAFMGVAARSGWARVWSYTSTTWHGEGRAAMDVLRRRVGAHCKGRGRGGGQSKLYC